MLNNVLVTGGTGFVGKNLQQFFHWTYVGDEFNLLEPAEAERMIRQYKPDAIVHLAGRVGGIQANVARPYEFLAQNVQINTNVVHAALTLKVPRLLAALSTCAWPDLIRPFSEGDLFVGPPTETNFGYAYAKRLLHLQVKSAREEFGLNYSTFAPCNIYGPRDHFSEDGHFVAALVKRLAGAKPGEEVQFWGTGYERRQQLFVNDLCRIIEGLLYEHNTNLPLLIAPRDDESISELIEIAMNSIGKQIVPRFNGCLSGQQIKLADTKEFRKIYPDFHFTKFSEGFRTTYEWYENE